MTIVEPTWVHAIKIFWSYTWRGILIGIFMGIPIGLILAAAQVDPTISPLIMNVILMPVFVWVIKDVVGTSYKGVKLVLIETEDDST